MNQAIVLLASVILVGVVFFVCSHVKHGTCDMAKLFNLVFVVISFVTGIFLCIHAFQLGKVSHPDAVWVGLAGFILAVFTFQQGLNAFRELFEKKVTPTKLEADH
jgi:hypothetical protein